MAEVSDKAQERRYRSYLKSELEAAALYSSLAKIERDPGRSEVFLKLVAAEMRHASRWARKLGIDPDTLKPELPGGKSRILRWTAKLFGTSRVLPVLLRLEGDEVAAYAADPEASDLVDEELEHARALEGLAYGGGVGQQLASIRGLLWGSGGSLRAAVLGVNDGLVSNFSLVMGVAGGIDAGGIDSPNLVLLAGVAGLLAGAFSMAAGEYVSMRSQRDIYENELRKEEIELREAPEEEKEELVLIYQAKGLSEEESRRIAERVMADPKVALDTMAREELGLDPSQLGSPWAASISSFLAFVSGAVVPILPYIFNAGGLAFSLSAVLSAVALAVVGGLVAVISGKSVAWGAIRMLLAGSLAAAVTFGVGSLIGVSVSEIV